MHSRPQIADSKYIIVIYGFDDNYNYFDPRRCDIVFFPVAGGTEGPALAFFCFLSSACNNKQTITNSGERGKAAYPSS